MMPVIETGITGIMNVISKLVLLQNICLMLMGKIQR